MFDCVSGTGQLPIFTGIYHIGHIVPHLWLKSNIDALVNTLILVLILVDIDINFGGVG